MKQRPDPRSYRGSDEVTGIAEDGGVPAGVDEGEQVLNELSREPEVVLITSAMVSVVNTTRRRTTHQADLNLNGVSHCNAD